MTREEYQRRAIALECPLNDTDKVSVPFYQIAELIEAGRMLDLAKRECFYTKKPDAKRNSEYIEFTLQMFHKAIELQDRGITFADLKIPHRLLHALIGMATEVAELWEAVMKSAIEDKPIDLDNLREEFGDLEWYPALGRDEAEKMDGYRGRFSQKAIQEANIAKLEERYKKDGDGHREFGGERDYAAEKEAMDRSYQASLDDTVPAGDGPEF